MKDRLIYIADAILDITIGICLYFVFIPVYIVLLIKGEIPGWFKDEK